MAKTVIGLFEDRSEAEKVVDELLKSGFERKDIGVISGEVLSEAATAASGATKGMAIGGLAGLLLGAASLALPGIGTALAAGPAVALLAGTTAGVVAGGLIGGLTARGVPEEEAHLYAEGLRRGGTILTVAARTDELANRAVEIMKRHGAVDMEERAAEWRRLGWGGRFAAKRAMEPAQGTGAAMKDQPATRTATASGTPAGTAAAQASAPGTAAQSAARPASTAGAGATGAAPSATPATAQAAPSAGGNVTEAPMAEQMQPGEDIDLPLATVCVYSVELELPLEEPLEAANRPTYQGPERRVRKQAFKGVDRRIAA